MNMRDASTGRLVWRSTDWDADVMFTREIRGKFTGILTFNYSLIKEFSKEEIPKDILKCRAVSREIVFSSVEEMKGFRFA